jgi:alkyl sulfatase BDS1-like metallo-beta-lactamase superfamily hydrolase
MKTHVVYQSIVLIGLGLALPTAGFDPPGVPVHPALMETYQGFFPPQVLTVTDGVYVARGYNRDNPTLIEGRNGLIVVDPGESIYAAQAAKAGFNAHLDNIFERKPVKAIIYTHHHDCHIHGASVFANEHTEIIGHETLMTSLFDEWFGQVYPSRVEGGIKMAGALFMSDPGWYVGYVLGGPQIFGPSGFLPPTKTVKDELKTTIAGVEINLISAPGESRDVVIVWLPGKKVLIQIGILYKSFPALVTMRGSGQRNPLDYINSLKLCRSLAPEYLIALHGADPITTGKENVSQLLTDFSDAIQFIHDQTVHHLNRGLSPDQIQDLVVLPPHLASRPYLRQTYGRVDWDVQHIFRYYRGYYTGNARDLFPQSLMSKASMAAELAGGVEALSAKAAGAFVAGNLEWALEFADNVLVLEPENSSAFATKAAAMLSLAEQTMNSQARNMLLSDYLVLTEQSPLAFGDPKRVLSLMSPTAVELMPLKTLHRIMAVSLNASKSVAQDVVVGLQLTEPRKDGRADRSYITLQVRRGILEVDPPAADNTQFVICTDSATWKQLVLGKLSPAEAIATKAVVISGAADVMFLSFMDLFN